MVCDKAFIFHTHTSCRKSFSLLLRSPAQVKVTFTDKGLLQGHLCFTNASCLKCLVFHLRFKISSFLNPLPDDKILDWSKLEQIADDI